MLIKPYQCLVIKGDISTHQKSGDGVGYGV